MLLPLLFLSLLVLGGCTSPGTAPGVAATPSPSTTPTTTPTPTSRSPALTFIGSDGNVWEMTWPQGAPRQLTTDGRPHGVHYQGLAWSPDGSRLAVGRSGATNQPISKLVVLTSEGAIVSGAALPGAPDNRPFTWSPDGALIAYRSLAHQYLPSGNELGLLTLFDAQTGQIDSQVHYDRGPTGCGGGGFGPVIDALFVAHFAYKGLDTFTWAPDQHTMLVAYGCFNGPSEQINPNTGATQALIYPEGASYQPGGTLILGILPNQALGVVDVSNHLVRTLVSHPGPDSAVYQVQATWSHDGQLVYYEYRSGIWSIGVDGTNAHQIIAGVPIEHNPIATFQLVPSLSPDDTLLLYLQVQGRTNPNDIATKATTQWYVAQADGSTPTPLPGGITEAVWRPGP